MNFKTLCLKKISLILLFSSLSSSLLAQNSEGWFVRPYSGLSSISDLSAETTEVGTQDGTADISLDSGFTAGMGLGFRYSEKIAAEIAWEYRSNESQVTLADSQVFNEGNYASNIFFLNGFYYFEGNEKWQPYLGAGLSWIQEIDIDLETSGTELSYSGSGGIGGQVFVGADYHLNNSWDLQAELRFGNLSGITLDGEDIAGTFEGLDYRTLTAQLGLVYRF